MLSYWAIDQVNMAELEDPMIADASCYPLKLYTMNHNNHEFLIYEYWSSVDQLDVLHHLLICYACIDSSTRLKGYECLQSSQIYRLFDEKQRIFRDLAY